jgi:hypothetical protein
MSNRVTDKGLQCIVDRLNRMTNSPMQPWAKDENGVYHAQIGNYHLSHAYGGVSLHRMVSDGGGVTEPVRCGHIPKRELQSAMFAYIEGLQQDTLRSAIEFALADSCGMSDASCDRLREALKTGGVQ